MPFHLLNLPPFVMDNMWFITLVASFLTWPLAWIADALFKTLAFGLIGNYVIMIIGALGGATGLMLYVGSANWVIANPQMPFFAAVAGAGALILLACIFKRILER